MSADLLAEFDSFYQAQSQKRPTAQQNLAPTQPARTDPFSFLGDPPQNDPAQQSWPPLSTTSFAESTGWSSGKAQDHEEQGEDEDAWGDFETAQTTASPLPSVPSSSRDSRVETRPSVNAQMQSSVSPQRTRIVRASTLDLISNNLIDLGGGGSMQPNAIHTAAAPLSKVQIGNSDVQPKKRDPSVLFDADDYSDEPEDENDGGEGFEVDDDDEFGQFETVATKPPLPPVDLQASAPTKAPAPAKAPAQTGRQSAIDLLSSLSLADSQPASYPQPPRSPSFQDRNPFPGLGITTPKATEFPRETKEKTPSPATLWPSFDPWEGDKPQQKVHAYRDAPTPMDMPSRTRKQQAAERTAPDLGWDWDTADSVEQLPSAGPASTAPVKVPASQVSDSVLISSALETSPDEIGPPPTNVPPPAIVLSLFPQLLDLANSSLFKPVSGQATSVRDRVASDPRTIDFLRGYLLLATVGARIIAGRKSRWHRDKFLSQGMTISAAGGKGGMKLAGIDKTQAAREDREATDVLDVWKRHVGRLRAAIAAANAAIADKSQHLKIPELNENMTVQSAKGVETAPRPCFLCGLKREERVARVDFDVEDSFHEWWIDHWGHRACRNFWLKHEATLRSR